MKAVCGGDGWVSIYSGDFSPGLWDSVVAITGTQWNNAVKVISSIGQKGFFKNLLDAYNPIKTAEKSTEELMKDLIRNANLLSDKVVVNGSGEEFKIEDDGSINLNDYNLLGFNNSNIDLSEWGNNGKIYVSAYLQNSTSAQGDSDEWLNRAIYKSNIMEFARTISSFGLKEASNVVILSNNTTSVATSSSEEGEGGSTLIGYAYGILYLVLVIETVMFIIQYLKRVFQLAMLTMIAPLIAFMYPIDKVGDGQAQAYNTWIKDYIFNVLLQPLHLLLYTIFIGAASELFHKNLIYALVMYGFMIPAEKYFKKIFGFDKASGSPPGGIAQGIGAGLGMSGFKALTGLGPHPGHKGGSGGGDKDRHKLKINRDKLQKPDASESGSPSPRSSGNESGGRSLIGNGLGGRSLTGSGSRNSARASGTNGNSPSPTASNSRNRGKFRNLLKAGGRNAGKSFSRAITGGKYDNLRSGAALAAMGGNIAKKGAKLGGRVAGTALLGSAGLMVGAATAIATGDINNLTKGASVGAVAGWNRGGEFADWASNGISDTISNIDTEWANIDEGHRARYFINEAKESFQDQELSSDQNEALEKFAPFVNFNGDDKKLDAYIQASKELYGEGVDISALSTDQMYAVDSMVGDAQKFGNLDDATNMQTYITAKRRELQNSVKADPASVSDAEIDEFMKAEQAKKLEDIKANETRQEEMEEKRNSALKNAETEAEKDKIRARYQKKLDKIEEDKREIEARVTDSASARQQIAEQKAANQLDALIDELAGKTQNTWNKTRKMKS